MELLTIVQKVEEYAKKVPPYEWDDDDNTPEDVLNFHLNIKTSSDDFWYCLENGYIGIELITSTPIQELTKKDLDEIYRIVEEYGIEF